MLRPSPSGGRGITRECWWAPGAREPRCPPRPFLDWRGGGIERQDPARALAASLTPPRDRAQGLRVDDEVGYPRRSLPDRGVAGERATPATGPLLPLRCGRGFEHLAECVRQLARYPAGSPPVLGHLAGLQDMTLAVSAFERAGVLLDGAGEQPAGALGHGGGWTEGRDSAEHPLFLSGNRSPEPAVSVGTFPR